MVNKILDAVSVQLWNTFGDSHHYYVEDVEQNLQKPCFTIDTVSPIQRSRSTLLYDRTVPLVIHRFTDDAETTKKSSYAMAERTIEALEYLPVDKTFIRGEDISWQMVDGVLQVFITYRFITRKVTETSFMENLEESRVYSND